MFTVMFAWALLTPVNSQAQVVRQITRTGTVQPASTPVGSPSVGTPEFDTAVVGDDTDGGDEADLGFDIDGPGSADSGTTRIDRSIARTEGHGSNGRGYGHARSNPEVRLSFEGLNFFDQRFANNGNQFSVEPPDQALCAGGGFVVESVNDVLNVYSKDGRSLLGVTDLNTFYNYPAAIDRAHGNAEGPEITDPTCHFDKDSHRWFHVVLTLDRIGSGPAVSGTNHLDIAVSDSPNPLGTWSIFSLPVQDDGTQGTPDHGCVERVAGVLLHGPCLGDYPHIGMDENALFITTNEFDFFSPGRFHGSQIYAISKKGLISGGPVNVAQFNTTALAPNLPFGIPGFTVFPAISPDNKFNRNDNGSEFALSSVAVFSNTGAFNQLVFWDLFNTASLNGDNPNVGLTATTVDTQLYAVPPNSSQKASPDFPLGECLADGTISTPLGLGCWRNFVTPPPSGPFAEAITRLPSNDSRMQQVSFANGKLFAALDSAVTVNGVNQAGAAFFVIQPQGSAAGLSGTVINQGIVALAGNNVSYPAVGVNHDGRGVMTFTVLGADHFPSAGYTSLDAVAGAGDIHIVAEGAGPSDGFSGYRGISNPVRPRWGDYGATAVDDEGIWIASEYIDQTCTFSTYLATNFTCGNTRGPLGNWSTRISRVKVD
jgi:hypothetical protein